MILTTFTVEEFYINEAFPKYGFKNVNHLRLNIVGAIDDVYSFLKVKRF